MSTGTRIDEPWPQTGICPFPHADTAYRDSREERMMALLERIASALERQGAPSIEDETETETKRDMLITGSPDDAVTMCGTG